MFWDKWIPNRYLIKSEVFVVEAYYEGESFLYYFTHLKNQGNKLTVVEMGVVTDLSFSHIVKKKIPLVLILNGKGVILKKITFSESSEKTLEALIRNNLPAINTHDFYIQLYRQENGTGFLSLCRKNMLDPLLEKLEQKKYEIAEVFIGAPSIIGLQPLWSKFNTIETTRQKIELTNGFVDLITSDVAEQNANIRIEDIELNRDHTLGLAGGLSYFTQRVLAESNDLLLGTLPEKHWEKNKFRFLVSACVIIAFILAITNVLFYSSYYDKNNKLEAELSVYQGKYEQVNKLLSDYQKNKDLIEGAGLLTKNKLSEYADKIGKTLPDEVILSEMYFNPKNENDEAVDSLATFQTKQLVLKGNCDKSFIVNEWLSVLKMQRFITSVNLENFKYSSNGVSPNFEVKLTIE